MADLKDVLIRGTRSECETWIRSQVHSTYFGENMLLSRVLGTRLMFISTRDYTLAPHLVTDGFWEIWITQAMARCLKPGMTAVDVGANIGYYTLLMAECVGPEGKVFSFEPNSELADLVAKSSSINGFGNRVRVSDRAAHSLSGAVLNFHVPNKSPMNARLALSPSDAEEFRHLRGNLQVQTVALDDVLPDQVDFIKIDTEGAERHVWSGLNKTLARNQDIQIFLEFNPGRYQGEAAGFLQQIQAGGFNLAYINYEGRPTASTSEDLLSGEEVILYLSRNPLPVEVPLPAADEAGAPVANATAPLHMVEVR